MIKNDKWIIEQSSKGMITPFEKELVKELQILNGQNKKIPVLSYGVSSYGYDIRLSSSEFLIFHHIPGTVVDPKKFNPQNLEPAPLLLDEDHGIFFILPAHSYGLGVSLERFKIPANITAICVGKSTYARCGLIANITPVETEWEGHLTLEFSNASNADCRIYADEGIAQLLFLEGEPCDITYADRNGKYQNQKNTVVLPKV